jgi:hypothetical protein
MCQPCKPIHGTTSFIQGGDDRQSTGKGKLFLVMPVMKGPNASPVSSTKKSLLLLIPHSKRKIPREMLYTTLSPMLVSVNDDFRIAAFWGNAELSPQCNTVINAGTGYRMEVL